MFGAALAPRLAPAAPWCLACAPQEQLQAFRGSALASPVRLRKERSQSPKHRPASATKQEQQAVPPHVEQYVQQQQQQLQYDSKEHGQQHQQPLADSKRLLPAEQQPQATLLPH